MTESSIPKAPGVGLWLRAVLFAVWMFGLALVMGVACLPLLLGSRRAALAPVRLWARWVLAGLDVVVGLRVEVQGLELAPTGPALIAAKHQGMLDILIGLALLPAPCFVMKKELMWVPIFGWFSAKTRMIAVDRSAGAKAVRAMTATAKAALAENRQIVVYPEGTRQRPGAEPAYKPGVAGLYRELGLPCHLMGTDSGRLWPAKGLVKYPGVATYVLLPPIPPGLKRGPFMSQMEARIEDACRALAEAD
jgi:1-acyl-sn-glycerol-3-phosphate acyltransferase